MERIVMACSVIDRLKGLLFKDPSNFQGSALLLAPCRDIHTFAMKHPIDVAFVAKDGLVLDVRRNIKPWTRVRDRKASFVIERFSSQEAWLRAGEVLNLNTIDNTLTDTHFT